MRCSFLLNVCKALQQSVEQALACFGPSARRVGSPIWRLGRQGPDRDLVPLPSLGLLSVALRCLAECRCAHAAVLTVTACLLCVRVAHSPPPRVPQPLRWCLPRPCWPRRPTLLSSATEGERQRGCIRPLLACMRAHLLTCLECVSARGGARRRRRLRGTAPDVPSSRGRVAIALSSIGAPRHPFEVASAGAVSSSIDRAM